MPGGVLRPLRIALAGTAAASLLLAYGFAMDPKVRIFLPLIAAMERGSAAQRDLIRHAIENGATEKLEAIVAVVRETGALDVTRVAAAAEAQRAIACAQRLPRNPCSEGLVQLAAQLLERRN